VRALGLVVGQRDARRLQVRGRLRLKLQRRAARGLAGRAGALALLAHGLLVALNVHLQLPLLRHELRWDLGQ